MSQSKEELIEEIRLLQKRMAELEAVDTERKKAEQIAKEARKYAEDIVETVRESLIILDTDLRVVLANPSFYQTFKASPKETVGCFLYDLGNGQWDIPKLRQLLEDILTKKTTIDDCEIEHRFETIGQKTMLLNARRLGSVQMILLAIEDITERKKTEQIVKEMQEKVIRSEKLAALGKLAGIVGHELRNPLGAIRNSVYFLKLKLASAMQDEKIKRHLDILDEEVTTSDKIITNILTFGRIKMPQLALVDIPEVIQASLEKLKVPADIEVSRQLEPGLPRIQADEDQLQQVFYNIMVNAIQAMSGGGRLTISAKMMDEFIEFDFADTGEGILQENLKKIFEPLFSTRIPGTGLGLTVCQDIVEAHKGNISVESEKGKGTKFTIKLPVIKEV